MDVIIADKLKLHMRIARGWLLRKIKKEFGVTLDDIVFDLENTGDPSVKEIWAILKKNANECIMGHQRNETKLWGAIMLWILSKDTAYRDLFFTTARDMLDVKDKIYDNIQSLAKDPEHWYPNAHQKSVIRRREGQESGELLEGGRPYDETVLVPSIQKPRIMKGHKGRDVEPVKIYVDKD